MTQMQGIVSILRSDNPEKTNKAASLRRTLSADMSSKRWLSDNVLPAPAMKKIASFEQIAVNSENNLSDSDEEECGVTRKCDENPTRMDIWSAIMSQKKDQDSGQLPPPYVHPLVKKSASSLSETSLKVCTESLGSETGSDVFSSESESSDSDSNNGEKPEQESDEEKVVEQNSDEQKVVKIATFPAKKANPPAAGRSFPPPLQSLAAARTDGPSLHMHSRRVDGRLVLEAVSVPQQKYFETQRHNGRFLLTVINKENPSEKEFPDEEKTGEAGILKNRRMNSSGVLVNAHKSTVTIKKITKMVDKNTKNSNNLLKSKAGKEEESVGLPPPAPRITSGLPPLPPPSPATTVNSYQYFWRAKPTVASVISDPMIAQHRPPTKTKELVLLRGNKADCFLSSLRGCKESRRSILMWESLCIATS